MRCSYVLPLVNGSVWLYCVSAVCVLVCLAQVSFFDPLLQQDREVRAGRMECTMQNLADALTVRTPQRLTAATPAAATAAAAAAAAGIRAGDASEELSTFMVYNMRRKVRGNSCQRPRAAHCSAVLMLSCSCTACSGYELRTWRKLCHIPVQCGAKGLDAGDDSPGCLRAAVASWQDSKPTAAAGAASGVAVPAGHLFCQEEALP
jgi:hypothetical protein